MDERRKEALPRNHQYTNPHPSDLPAMAGTGGISQRTPSRTADKGPGTRYGNRCIDPQGNTKASFRYRYKSLRRFPRLCDDLRSPGYDGTNQRTVEDEAIKRARWIDPA